MPKDVMKELRETVGDLVDEVIILERIIKDIDEKILKKPEDVAILKSAPFNSLINWSFNYIEIKLLRQLIVDRIKQISEQT